MALAVSEKTLFACEPISRTVPTTITRITASITAYSAISCPSSFDHMFCRSSFTFVSPLTQISPCGDWCSHATRQEGGGEWPVGAITSTVVIHLRLLAVSD